MGVYVIISGISVFRFTYIMEIEYWLSYPHANMKYTPEVFKVFKTLVAYAYSWGPRD